MGLLHVARDDLATWLNTLPEAPQIMGLYCAGRPNVVRAARMKAPALFAGFVALMGVSAMACNQPAPPAADTQSAPSAAPAPVNPHANMQPADPHMGSPHAGMPMPMAQPPADLSTPPRAGGLTWNDAAPLKRRAPKSSMRVAEYGLEGDDKLELTVFYFGPDQGGSVDANITRWLGQLTQPDGSDTTAKAKRATRKVGDVDVSTLEVSGTYSGGMAMMAGGAAPEPMTNATMLGAIAAGPEGPIFFKLIGPSAAVEHSRAAFDQMIGSLHKP
jgi:hypothetical protein